MTKPMTSLGVSTADTRNDYYLVAKGAREIAWVHEDWLHFSTPHQHCFVVARLPVTGAYGQCGWVIYAVGRGEQTAAAFVEAVATRDHRSVGMLLGYAPELVDSFCSQEYAQR